MTVFRAYFNRKREAPQIWSVDEGSQNSEVNVIDFVIHSGCMTRSRNALGQVPVNDNSPSAWIEIEAEFYGIHDGVAHFFGLIAHDGRS